MSPICDEQIDRPYWSTPDMIQASIDRSSLMAEVTQHVDRLYWTIYRDALELIEWSDFTSRLGRFKVSGAEFLGRRLLTVSWGPEEYFVTFMLFPQRMDLLGFNAFVDEALAMMQEIEEIWDPVRLKLSVSSTKVFLA